VNNANTDPRIRNWPGQPEAASQLTSYIAVPRLVGGVWSAVLVAKRTTPREWKSDDVRVLHQMAGPIWLAVDNERLFDKMQREIEERRNAQDLLAKALDRERKLLQTVQRSLMKIPRGHAFAGMAFGSCYEAALSDLEIGGDFLDVFAISPDVIALIVGDVSGKGLEAASQTAEVKFLLRGYLRRYASVAKSLQHLNEYLKNAHELDNNTISSFICVTVALVDTKTGYVTVTNAGNEPPVVIKRSSDAVAIDITGLPLGISTEVEYDVTSFTLDPGDRLVMFTDGITEARATEEFFGVRGLIAAAQRASDTESLKDAAQLIVDSARAHSAGRLRDDTCVLLAMRE